MTSRERILRVLNHKIPDRVPIHDDIWPVTVNRWHKEGLPEDMTPADYFDYEFAIFNSDLSPRFPVRRLEQNEEFIVFTTQFGGERKHHRDYSTTPEIIDWSIKTKEDWKEIKKKLKPDMTRVNWASGLQENQTAYEEGKFLCFSCISGYDVLQNYMKSEQILISMAEDPTWVREMLMTISELIVITADLMLKNGFKFDALFNHNDIGHKNGLLFSPEVYKKTHYDADLLLYEYFHSKGMKNILHSCGNITEIIPTLLEIGVDCIQPLEVKSGMDAIALKEKFGDKLSFMGGIDVRSISDKDPNKIKEEIKNKFSILKNNGGYIYHSDHSIPNNVSFQQYTKLIELIKEYGVYPEYEELLKEEDSVPVEEKSLSKKKEESKKDVKKEVKKKEKKSGFFGKKKGATSEKQVEKPVIEKKSESVTKEGKKFKLPFGKKK